MSRLSTSQYTVKAACGLLSLLTCKHTWIKSKLHEVTVMRDRKSYRSYITKKGLGDKYSQPIHAASRGYYFDFYALYGEWRVGDRDIAGANITELKAAILRSIEEYADVKKAIDESQLAPA
jgi:hypothetical protein